MKKIVAKDLQDLTEIEQGLLFNYFGSVRGAENSRRLAFFAALASCIFIGMGYYPGGILSDVPNFPEWFHGAQWFAKVFTTIGSSLIVLAYLWMARSRQMEADALGKELAKCGLYVNGLTADEVFEHAVLSMLPGAGVPIKE